MYSAHNSYGKMKVTQFNAMNSKFILLIFPPIVIYILVSISF